MSKPLPAIEGILSLLLKLPEQESCRLMNMLADRTGERYGGRAIVPLKLFMVLFNDVPMECMRALFSADQEHSILRKKLDRTLRKPDPKVAEETDHIKELRSAGKTWKAIDKAMGLNPGSARQRVYRKNKKKSSDS